jgi:hypothetical protein
MNSLPDEEELRGVPHHKLESIRFNAKIQAKAD